MLSVSERLPLSLLLGDFSPQAASVSSSADASIRDNRFFFVILCFSLPVFFLISSPIRAAGHYRLASSLACLARLDAT